MASYTRQSSFSDGDTISSSLFNNEYNQLVTAFSYSSSGTTGHRHDGTAAEGGNIHTIGDQDFLNKIVVDSSNNRWGVYVQVSGAAVEQIRFQDGSIVPVTSNDIDLGTSSLQFKDLHIDGTASIDSLTLTSGATVTVILDEDNLSTNSATALATQQSIKAYVDSQVTGQALSFSGDSGGSLSIDLDSEALTITGGTGIDTTGSTNDMSIAIDSTVATLTGSQTLTNKTLTSPDINGGTIDGATIGGSSAGDITYANLSDGTITITAFADEDDMSSNSATLVPTQQSVKAYVDAQITAEDLDFQADSGGALSIDLDSETMTFTGGTGIDTSGSGNAVTFAIDSTVTTLAGTQTLTNKTLTTPVITSISNSGTVTLPSGTTTLVGTATSDVLTNKTISGSSNTLSNIGNSSLSNSSVSFGGISVALGSSDATPAFDLSDATGYTGDSNLVTTGTISSGVWQGTAVADTYVANDLTISGGTVNNTVIGGSSPAAADFTTVDTTGNATVGGNLAVTGNLTINGTTSTVNSTTVTIDDPIFTLGGDTTPSTDDNKDRGIEFKWHNGTGAKLGFFGYDDSASVFTFIPDASNTSEVFSGSAGNVAFGTISGTSLDISGDIDVDGTANLDVVDIDGAVDMSSTLTVGGEVFIAEKLSHTGDTDTHFKFAGANDIRIVAGDVEHAAFDGTIVFNQSGSSSMDFRVESDTQEHMLFVDASLNRIGIANNAPATALDVTGTVTADAIEIATTASDTGVELTLNGNKSSNGGVGSIVFENAGDSVGMIRSNRASANDAADMLFYTQATGGANTERMRISSSGNVGIGISPQSFTDLMVNTATDRNIGIFDNAAGATICGLTDAGASAALRLAGSPLIFTGNGGSGTEAMRITSAGSIQIPNQDAINELEFTGTEYTNIYSATTSGMDVGTTGSGYLRLLTNNTERMRITSAGALQLSDVDSPNDINTAIYSNSDVLELEAFGTSGAIAFSTGSSVTERMRIDSSGSLLINSTVTSDTGGIKLYSSSGVNALPATSGTTQTGGALRLRGGDNAVLDMGLNSTTTWIQATDKLNLSYDYTLALNPNGGNVGIGTSSPQNLLALKSGTNTDIEFGSESGGGFIQTYNRTSSAYGYLRFITSSSETMRLDTSGNVLVGTTDSSPYTAIEGFIVALNNGSKSAACFGADNVASRTVVNIVNPNGSVGSITTNASATAYNTSSDQRLKNNIVDAPSASDDIDAIQVRSFDWKADGSHQKYGMVAQELQSVAPEAVSGDADSEEMMGVDYSKLVPMLVKEIQSLRARVAQLES